LSVATRTGVGRSTTVILNLFPWRWRLMSERQAAGTHSARSESCAGITSHRDRCDEGRRARSKSGRLSPAWGRRAPDFRSRKVAQALLPVPSGRSQECLCHFPSGAMKHGSALRTYHLSARRADLFLGFAALLQSTTKSRGPKEQVRATPKRISLDKLSH